VAIIPHSSAIVRISFVGIHVLHSKTKLHSSEFMFLLVSTSANRDLHVFNMLGFLAISDFYSLFKILLYASMLNS